MAVASLVCSLVGILIGLGAILGIIFGFVARSRIKAAGGAKKGSGMALAGIIIGFVVVAANIAIVTVVLINRSSPASPSVSGAVFGGNPTAADDSLARSEALPTSAYPAGFSEGAASTANPSGGFYGADSDAEVTGMAACLGTSTANVDTNPAEFAGRLYQDQNGTTVAENVEVYPTTDDALADVGALARPDASSCWLRFNSDISTEIAKGIGNGAKAGTATASPLAVPAAGDHAAGLQVDVPLTVDGNSITEYIALVVVQKGRSEAVFVLSGAGAPQNAQLATLTQEAAAHLTN